MLIWLTWLLDRTGQSALSNLELYTRYTSNLWLYMHQYNMRLPPVAKRPLGAPVPPASRYQNNIQQPSKGGPEKEVLEVCPITVHLIEQNLMSFVKDCAAI